MLNEAQGSMEELQTRLLALSSELDLERAEREGVQAELEAVRVQEIRAQENAALLRSELLILHEDLLELQVPLSPPLSSPLSLLTLSVSPGCGTRGEGGPRGDSDSRAR